MKLAIYCPDLPPVPGGVSDHTLALARSLEELGLPPVVLACRGEPERFAPLRVRTGLGPRDVAAAARAEGADAVLVQYVPFLYARRGLSPSLIAGVRAMHRAGLRVAVYVHEPFVPFTRLPWLVTGWPMRWQLAALLRRAAFVYAPVPRFVEIARRHARAATAVRLVPVGATLPVSAMGRKDARRLLGLDEGDVAVGAFSPHAAGFLHEWVAEAARRLVDDRRVVWVTFGHGSERLPAGLPSEARVLRLGTLSPEDAGNAMRALDVAVAPFFEGLTMRRTSAMLALAHGVPTVSSTGHLFDGRLGALAACEPTADAFAARLASLVRDPAERRAWAEKAGAFDEVASIGALARTLAADLGASA